MSGGDEPRDELRMEQARLLIHGLAAAGNCIDHVDVQVAAPGRGYDSEIRRLFVSKNVRDKITEICQQARKARESAEPESGGPPKTHNRGPQD